jgi:hypothetical protein
MATGHFKWVMGRMGCNGWRMGRWPLAALNGQWVEWDVMDGEWVDGHWPL